MPKQLDQNQINNALSGASNMNQIYIQQRLYQGGKMTEEWI